MVRRTPGTTAPPAPPAPPRSKDAVVEANRKLLLKRSNAGIKKYGVSLADANLTHAQLLQHLLEELLDASNYIQAQLQKPRRVVAWRYAGASWRDGPPPGSITDAVVELAYAE